MSLRRLFVCLPGKPQGMRGFIILWAGQFISLIGSGMTSFALSIWVYTQTGSVTIFALISLCATLPAILVAPIAGVCVDRWSRRQALLVGNGGAGCCVLLLAIMLISGQARMVHIYFLISVLSVFQALHELAYTTSIPQLVPKDLLGRANGMVELAGALSHVLAPLIAGALVSLLPVATVISIDSFSFAIALVPVILIAFPSRTSIERSSTQLATFRQDLHSAVRYLKGQPGLMGLLAVFAMGNLLFGMMSVLLFPLALSFTSASTMSYIVAASGVGAIAGGVVMSIWGGTQRRARAILWCEGASAFCLVLAGLRPSALLLGVAATIYGFIWPLSMGNSQALWQSKVTSDTQGRIFALRSMIAGSSLPIAYLIAGPLADRVFTPLLTTNGLLAGTIIGHVLGVGPGRGVGLLFIVLGIYGMLVVALAAVFPQLRQLDTLPDAGYTDTALAL
jgi:MFS transporter